MKLQDQVCSLEQATKLRQLGVLQNNSVFAYVRDSEKEDWQLVYTDGYSWSDYPGYQSYTFAVHTYTAVELGIMLGNGYPSWQFTHPKTGALIWICTRLGPNDPLADRRYRGSDLVPMNTYACLDLYENTECEARANMLIALIKAGSPNHTTELVNERLKNA